MFTTSASGNSKTRPLLLAGLAGLVLALGACGGKEPGEDAVATVDGYEITIAELNHELTEGGVQDTQDPAARRAAIEAIINRKLLAGMALDSELDRTPDFILKEQRLRDVLLADAAVQSLAPQGARFNEEDVDAFLETNLEQGRGRTVFAIEGLQFARPKKGEVMEQLGEAKSMGDIVRILRAADIEAQGGNLAWDSATMPTDLVRQLNQLPDGEPFLIPEGNRVVAGVIREKRNLPLEPGQSRKIAESAVEQQTVRARVMDWLEQARHSAEIQYGEGFAPDEPEDAPKTPASSAAADAARPT